MLPRAQSRAKSKSPKHNSLEKALHKTKSELSLKRKIIYGGGLQPSVGQHRLPNRMANGKDVTTTSKLTNAPKYHLQVRKHPCQPAPLTSTEQEVRQIEKELKIEKPKIMKKAGEPYESLQQRLVSIQSLLGQLKETMHQLQRPRKSRSKNRNKSKKSSSVEEYRPREVEEEKKQDDCPPNVVQKYVCQSKKLDLRRPIKQPTASPNEKQLDYQQISTRKDTSLRHEDQPYYTGKLVQSLSSGLPCEVEEHLLQALQAINYMKSIKSPSQGELYKLKAHLPEHPTHTKTILLDLDETLIHCNEDIEGQVRLPIKLPDGQVTKAGVNIRPHAKRFLERVSQKFEVVVFTASHPCYANVVLDHLDPQNKFISQRLFRQHCYLTESGIYVKDLRVIQNRDTKNMLLVDNAPYSYYFQMENGVPIVPYYDNKDDSQLLRLQKFLLEKVHPSDDVRTVLRQHFKLHRYPQYGNINQLIEALYVE